MRHKESAAIDFIRKKKFISPEKILKTEKLLKENDLVINFWCRQSGKTLTSMKIIHDLAISKPGAKIVIVCTKMANAQMFIETLTRSFERMPLNIDLHTNYSENIKKTTTVSIELNNGSHIIASSVASKIPFKARYIGDVDLFVFDEFDFFKPEFFDIIITAINSILKPGFYEKLKRAFSFKEKHTPKFLFSSSAHDNKNFISLQLNFDCVISYMNWKDLVLSDEKVKQLRLMLGEKSFEQEYDSYPLKTPKLNEGII